MNIELVIIVVSLIMLALIFRLAFCAQHLVVGGLYSVSRGEGTFGVVKLLAFDRRGVHLCIYKNSYKKRPSKDELGSLELGTIHEGDTPGIGHLPVTKKKFYRWYPLLISHAEITADELEGYEMWKESGGGYWE